MVVRKSPLDTKIGAGGERCSRPQSTGSLMSSEEDHAAAQSHCRP